jgi:hypothetical protein
VWNEHPKEQRAGAASQALGKESLPGVLVANKMDMRERCATPPVAARGCSVGTGQGWCAPCGMMISLEDLIREGSAAQSLEDLIREGSAAQSLEDLRRNPWRICGAIREGSAAQSLEDLRRRDSVPEGLCGAIIGCKVDCPV